MSTRKSSVFYGLLIALTSLVVGLVIASKLDLTPASLAGTLDVPVTNSAPLNGPIDATTFRNIAHDAGPSVVSITTKGTRVAEEETLEFFGLPLPGFGGRRGQPTPRQEQPERPLGAGSGFIIDKAGFILTNNHVVENATAIEIQLATMKDGEDGLAARVVGRDELTDTALLQIIDLPKTPLTAAKFGDSSQIAPGDWVMAIGNPFGLSNTVTVGVVSAVGRQKAVSVGRSENFIQTDAAINSGNSGGPLLNIRGEVIGINSMIYTSGGFGAATGGNIGIGFAVPINTVRDLLPQLREGKVTRGRLAVSLEGRPISEEDAKELGLPGPGGAEIKSVEPGGPADKAGILAADVIVEFNGKPIRENGDLVSAVSGTRPGTTVPLKLVRNKKTITLNVTVAELNLVAEQRAAAVPEGAAPRGTEPTATDLGMTILGVTAREQKQLQIPAGRGGAVVSSVTPFGPAANAGLETGDVILSVQGQAVRSADEVSAALKRLASGRTVRMIVWRFSPEQGRGQEILFTVRKP
jgi:serine protease Do